MRSYLRFGDDLQAGMLVPGQLDDEIGVAPVRPAPAALLARLDTGPLDDVLRGLEPADPDYRRLVPQDLIDLLVEHRLHFDQTRQQGLVFNLIGALSEYGKLGLVCIADTGPQPPEVAPEAAATVNGVQFPLDPRRTYVVDLWSPPTEVAFVEQLARATICYRSPGCEVLLISPLPAPAASDGRQRRSR